MIGASIGCRIGAPAGAQRQWRRRQRAQQDAPPCQHALPQWDAQLAPLSLWHGRAGSLHDVAAPASAVATRRASSPAVDVDLPPCMVGGRSAVTAAPTSHCVVLPVCALPRCRGAAAASDRDTCFVARCCSRREGSRPAGTAATAAHFRRRSPRQPPGRPLRCSCSLPTCDSATPQQNSAGWGLRVPPCSASPLTPSSPELPQASATCRQMIWTAAWPVTICSSSRMVSRTSRAGLWRARRAARQAAAGCRRARTWRSSPPTSSSCGA